MFGKNRKTALAAVLLVLVAVEVVFANVNKKNTDVSDTNGLRLASESEETVQDVQDLTSVEEENTLDVQDLENADEIEVSANLNVVYRSTVLSSEDMSTDSDDEEINDFTSKILAYTNERLIVYAEPSEASEEIGVMYSGTIGDVLEVGEEWSLIQTGEAKGYVKNNSVLFGEEAQVVAEILGTRQVYAPTDVVVYSDPDVNSVQIDVIAAGSTVDALDDTGRFVLVDADGVLGYVLEEAIEITYGLETGITIEEEQRRIAEEQAAAEAAERARQEAAAKMAEAIVEAEKKNVTISATTREPYAATEEEIHLLATIIYYESGWEPYEGQVAVGNVVLNRVLSPRFTQNTIASVIYAPGQFTGVSDGNNGPSERFLNEFLSLTNEQLEVRGSYSAALEVLAGNNNIGDMLFFISTKKANFAKYTSYTIINNHCFYIY